ncbi:MAG: hypothetical protein WBC93_17900 [Sulfitobacter sp.]
MRMFTILLLLAVLAAGAFATNPTRADFETEIELTLQNSIDAADVNDGGDAASAILIATCKISRNQCANLIRSLMKVDYQDRMFFSTAKVEMGQDSSASCIGLLTRIICRGL